MKFGITRHLSGMIGTTDLLNSLLHRGQLYRISPEWVTLNVFKLVEVEKEQN